MNGIAAVILYAVLLTAAVRAGLGIIAERRSDGDRRIPVATITALVVVGVPTLLQLTAVPSLLEYLERDRTAIGDGQVWRLLTSLVSQDGGLGCSVFIWLASPWSGRSPSGSGVRHAGRSSPSPRE